MVNPLRGEARFKAGDKDLILVFDVNVFCELEEDTGLSISELLAEIQGNPSFRMLRNIFCAALQPKQPETTKKQAGDWMSDAGMKELSEALKGAIQRAMPPPKKGEGKDPANPPATPRPRRR